MFRMLNLRSLAQNKNKFLAHKSGIVRVDSTSSVVYCPFRKVSHLCNRERVPDLLIARGNAAVNVKRVHSTTPSAEIVSSIGDKKTKRRRSNENKFTELLAVKDGDTKEMKATVQKLKSKKLANFIHDQIAFEAYSPSTSISPSNKITDELPRSSRVRPALPTEMSQWNFEETPVIYIGGEMRETDISHDVLSEIIESVQILKEVHRNRAVRVSGALTPHDELDPALDEEVGLLESEAILPEEAELAFEEPIDLTSTHSGAGSSKKTKRGSKQPHPLLDGSEKGKKFCSKYYKSSEIECLARQRSFQMTLNAYLDICITTGMVNRAYATTLNYRHKRKRREFDVGTYNQLIHAYAGKGNLSRVKDIVRVMREDSITPNAQMYAGILECLGRLEPTAEVLKLAKQYVHEASTVGYTMTDILDQSKFSHDQQDVVLSLFHRMVPNYVPEYRAPILTYNNHLLDALNVNVLPIGSKPPAEEGCWPGSEIMTPRGGFKREELQQMAQKQVDMELSGYLAVKSIEKFPVPTEQVMQYRKELDELKKVWSKQIAMAFHRDFNTLKAVTETKSSRTINLFPYLKALSVQQFTEILLDEVQMLLEGSDTFSFVISQLQRELGRKVESRYHVEQKRMNGVLRKTCEIYDRYTSALADGQSSDNPRQLWQRLVHEMRCSGPSMDIQSVAWPKAAVLGVGKFLYNILRCDLKINVNATNKSNRKVKLVPAFYTLFRYEAKMAKEQIKPHPVLMRLYRKSQPDTLKFDVNLVPMLCPPQPWSTPRNGGYILAESDLIRLPHQAHQQTERIDDADPQDMYPTLDALNQLASIPWVVNGQILDVIVQVFNDGGNAKLDVPEPPSSLPPIVETVPRSEMSGYEKYHLLRKRLYHRRKQGDMYSLWCDALYRLSLASHYRDKVFWLPQNIDFRGRVYPIPPHLNHLGHDLARCLLVFHQKKPLGPDGFRWLKLHCINLTGLKKRESVEERVRYADEIMDDILDSADHPLTGKMWWSNSDEPWQTLACCMEIAKVHRCADPEKFESGFPIHQDGSCNGLQHYAALGRDTPGAISVNLAPADVPQDVYSAVAALVEENRAKDAQNNVKVAAVLDGFIRRKVIKQTVMTTVYGVTRYGARKQIARQLEYIDEFPKEWVWPASSYLTVKTFDALSEMFTSAKEIQDWFTDCARLISAVCAQNVEWVTPLGLPVVQPYNRADRPVGSSKSVQLPEHFAMDSYEKPNIMKQKNAFPPNFVHSLDSSHMMLTSLYCERAGLTFISVHDCYWTHACTVPTMNRICREQFVALHSEPILEDLSRFLVQKYSYDENEISNDGSVIDLTKRKLNRILQQCPDKGDFDLRKVLDSVYFFS
ncbi:DNA-directed RNA polymerase, mitochondrial [Anopheles moucheti]|uniref:DNA-directed RNA polymerase, mitochondrial n=1 Tax=Anopheles moucheti TaxID=186751 RepID=UPI0022F1235D|nr:DNA-directed RNA polymerase, mitochondrial [Anopheles moucheti]